MVRPELRRWWEEVQQALLLLMLVPVAVRWHPGASIVVWWSANLGREASVWGEVPSQRELRRRMFPVAPCGTPTVLRADLVPVYGC